MRTALVFVLLWATLGCGPENLEWWEGTTAGDRVFVLNKRTGDLYTVQEGELRRVARNEEAVWQGPDAQEQSARLNTVDTHRWLFGDVMRIEVNTKYRSGKVEVRGTVEPFMKELSTIEFGRLFGIEFRDGKGFGVVEVQLVPGDFTQVVDEIGKPVSYVFAKSAPVSPADWSDAVFLDVSWVAQTSDRVERWKKENPKDAAAQQALADEEKKAVRARIKEMLREMEGSEGPEEGQDASPEENP